jgi:hypothetical protein
VRHADGLNANAETEQRPYLGRRRDPQRLVPQYSRRRSRPRRRTAGVLN